MAGGVVQRRGVPQAEAVAERFGQEDLGHPTELHEGIFPIAKVSRVDLPAMGGVAVAALAANRSMVQLFNPARSNTDLLIKRIWMSSLTDQTINLRTHDNALPNLAPFIGVMVRQEGTNQKGAVGQVRSLQGAAVGTTIGIWQVLANVLELVDFMVGDGEHFDGLILQPGRGVLLSPSVDDAVMRATFQWLEREIR